MQWLRILALAAAVSSAAGSPTAASTPRPPLYADLADRARSLPAEFAAEALLRISDAQPALNYLAWKREVLEDAFRLAASAQQPYSRHNWSGKPGSLFDKAYSQGLDACTLQCKAVHAMLAIDYKEARELFSEMPAPQIPRVTCEDALVSDVSVFYETVNDVARRAFNAKEVSQDEPFRLLQRFAGDLSSPVQVQPIARMLAGAPLKPAQLEALVAEFAGAIAQLSGDDRSFAAAIAGGADAALADLPERCASRKISAQPLISAWRDYVARQQKASRCTDPGSAQPLVKCESVECRHLAEQFTKLVMAPNGYGLSPEQKASAEWGAKMREYLAALAEWKDADDPDEYFEFKGRFYSELFYLAPDGPDRDLLLTSLLQWLQQNLYQHDHRVEWFYPVNALLIQAFANPAKMQTTVRELRRSVDPVIALYAQLEQLLPRPMDATLGLL